MLGVVLINAMLYQPVPFQMYRRLLPDTYAWSPVDAPDKGNRSIVAYTVVLEPDVAPSQRVFERCRYR